MPRPRPPAERRGSRAAPSAAQSVCSPLAKDKREKLRIDLAKSTIEPHRMTPLTLGAQITPLDDAKSRKIRRIFSSSAHARAERSKGTRMIRKILGSFLMVGIIGAALSTATDASAGSQWQGAYLFKGSDGAGWAYGTFQGFRNSADPSASVTFSSYNGNTTSVGFSLNGNYGWCSVPASLTGAFNQALLSRDYFEVDWNASGVCTAIYLMTSSEYGSY